MKNNLPKQKQYHRATSILPLQNKSQKGFTLLETLVAIFILTLSLTGPVYIASVAFRNTIDSRDNISAQYIAEEVVEVIRNRRDKYILSQTDSDWISTVTGGTIDCENEGSTSDKKCVMTKDTDLIPPTDYYVFEACVGGVCPNISFDPTGDEAVYGKVIAPSVSKFKREFYFETYGDDHDSEVRLIVDIKWEDKGRTKKYSLSERLYSVDYKGFFKPDPVSN